MLKRIIPTTFFVFAAVLGVFAQLDDRKIEVGGVVTVLDLEDSNGEKPIGVGARFGYNFHKYVGLDTEVTYFPQDSGAFGQTVALAGVKAGYRHKRFGVFAKARTGIAHFGAAPIMCSVITHRRNLRLTWEA